MDCSNVLCKLVMQRWFMLNWDSLVKIMELLLYHVVDPVISLMIKLEPII